MGPHKDQTTLPPPAHSEGAAADALFAVVYEELRQLARIRLRSERDGRTMSGTDLVHEVYLRLQGDRRSPWQSRLHFFGAAAEAMRRILVERARRRGSQKRGGGRQRVPLAASLQIDDPDPAYLIALDEAITRLEEIDPRAGRVVVLRQFAGMTVEDVGALLGISAATVKRDWAYARAWLYDEMGRPPRRAGGNGRA